MSRPIEVEGMAREHCERTVEDALAASLSLGFLAAFPVNLTLVHRGVGEGVRNPADMSASSRAAAADWAASSVAVERRSRPFPND